MKQKPIVARTCTFSRTLYRLCVITSSFDWFTGLSPSFLSGKSNYFGFGFTSHTHLKNAPSTINMVVRILVVKNGLDRLLQITYLGGGGGLLQL